MELTEECAICLNEYDQNRQPIFLLPCKHTFCQQCVSILTIKDCPLCRIQFHGMQKNYAFINNYSIEKLKKIEDNLDKNYHVILEIFDRNSKNLANIKLIFQLNFDQLQNNEFKSGFTQLFNSKLKNNKMDEIKFYFISLKYSAIKQELIEKKEILKSPDGLVLEENSLDEIVKRIERFLAKESLVEHSEYLDAKKFYQNCYSEFVMEKFGYLKEELELSEKLLDNHFKINKEMFTRNSRLVKEIASKLELKRLPKDVNLCEFKEMVNEKLHVKELIDNFENFEKKYLNLKRSIDSKKAMVENLFELCEYDLLDQKSQIEDLIIKLNVFIKLNKIEKLSFKPFETSYLTLISDYRSNHNQKKFNKYKIINHLLRI
ncbi:hypothetical protein BpHYR1_024957 [Brachionus plicatilis]|uniref:RING-type domain-containing protein n=1 Tax=Brachionus plicatilis TaxID=10195 RepID=A0A3M7P8I5_BRAPC|nr:hypothetical protein BpHYR1_024957 [Brachionus plicatilis]